MFPHIIWLPDFCQQLNDIHFFLKSFVASFQNLLPFSHWFATNFEATTPFVTLWLNEVVFDWNEQLVETEIILCLWRVCIEEILVFLFEVISCDCKFQLLWRIVWTNQSKNDNEDFKKTTKFTKDINWFKWRDFNLSFCVCWR